MCVVTMSSVFTVALTTSFLHEDFEFFCVAKAWFINPVGYSVMCRGDCLGYIFVYINDYFPCDSTSLKCTKQHKDK